MLIFVCSELRKRWRHDRQWQSRLPPQLPLDARKDQTHTDTLYPGYASTVDRKHHPRNFGSCTDDWCAVQGGAVRALSQVTEVDFDWPKRFWKSLSKQDQDNLIRHVVLHLFPFEFVLTGSLSATSLATSAERSASRFANVKLRSSRSSILRSGRPLRRALVLLCPSFRSSRRVPPG